MKIFLSGVSSEFASVRREVASDLRAHGHEVKLQDDFRQEADTETTLEKIHDYIKACDAVICLIGVRSGAFPPDAAVKSDYRAMLPAGVARASYTQWELHFARHYGKRRSLYMAAVAFMPDQPAPAGDDPTSQAAFVAWIKAQGFDRTECTDTNDFCRRILREDWPHIARAKPNNLPYASLGTLFKGRDAFLDQLRESLKRTTARASAVVGKAVHGLGGVGKTRLAVEYAWTHQDQYTALLFVIADSPENLKSQIANLCGPLVLNLPEQNLKEEQARFEAALRWLQAHPGWFLILDNVDNEPAAAEVEKLLTQLAKGSVVITSRLRKWSGGVEALELGVLSPDDATSFLLDRTNDKRRHASDDAAVARLVATDDLGQLALALEQAAAFINRQTLTFDGYRAAWRASDEGVDWYDEREMKYPRSVAVTWQTSVAQLSRGGRCLLERLAWFAPEPVSESLLDIKVQGIDSNVRTALVNLADFSLISRSKDAPTFSIHRVVQDVTRRRLGASADCVALRDALDWISNAFDRPGDTHRWPLLVPLLQHAVVIARFADLAKIPEPTALLMNNAGHLLTLQARYAEAEPLFRRALVLDETSHGRDHAAVARDLHNLADLLRTTARFSEAEPLFGRALAILETSFGPSHPEVAAVLKNLATLQEETGRFAEAEPLMRRALATAEEWYGQDAPEIASVLNSLAFLLRKRNQPDEAELLYRRALAINEKSHGTDHSERAPALNNLALLLLDLGRVSEAEPLFRRALAIFEQSYGLNHPNVATGLNNVAVLLRSMNRFGDAEPLLRRALAIDEASYGPDHPHVARDLNNLAHLLQDTNRLSEAEPPFRRALAIFENSFSGDHPDVATALKNLARLLQATNRISEAEPLFRRALEIETHRLGEAEPLFRRAVAIIEKSHGPDHASVAAPLLNLALFLQATNRLAEAEPLLRRGLAILERSSGPDHPDVASYLDRLGGLLRSMNRLDEGEFVYRRALVIDETSQGPDHPDVARDLNNLATLLHEMNRVEEAQPLLRRAVLICTKLGIQAGHEHSYAKGMLDNYNAVLRTTGKSETESREDIDEIFREAQATTGRQTVKPP